jgi:hypothetical protein
MAERLWEEPVLDFRAHRARDTCRGAVPSNTTTCSKTTSVYYYHLEDHYEREPTLAVKGGLAQNDSGGESIDERENRGTHDGNFQAGKRLETADESSNEVEN